MIERRVELQSPPTSSLRHMTSDSGEMVRQLSVTKTVNSQRRRRLKIWRLKYTCQTKTQITITEGESENLNKEERESNDSNCTTPEITAREGLSEISKVSSSDHSSKNEVGLTPRFTRIRCGSVSVIGRRREMEDTVRVELAFASKGGEKYDFFGVYDGHGGARVAEACRDRMHEVLLEEIVGRNEGEIDWDRVMDGCFVRMDEEVVSDKMMGSTAVVAVVGKEVVVVANCGDSRAVISRGGDAVALSVDHKPDRPDELDRIEADGGRVINWNGYRVLGVLATSRSIGDQYLKPYVISKPEVTVSKRTSADEFLILASDGLWDIISNEVACQVVKRCLSGRMRRKSGDVKREGRAAEAAAVLAELAMARGGRDNISVIVVELKERRDFSCQ